MKMIKGREGLIYKMRLEEQYCPALAKGRLAGGRWGGAVVKVRTHWLRRAHQSWSLGWSTACQDDHEGP